MKRKLFGLVALGIVTLMTASTVKANLSFYEETFFYLDDGTQVSSPLCSEDSTPNCAQKYYRDSPSEDWQPVKDNGQNVYVTGIRLD